MEVLIAKLDHDRNRFMIAREVDRGSGPILDLYLLPVDTMEWRAAEYQIDPVEVDLLMDIVLYESEIGREEDTPKLFTADTIEEARDLYVGRIQALKARIRPIPNQWMSNAQRLARLRSAGAPMEEWEPFIKDDALQNIRDLHVMDPEVLEEKRLLIKQRRDSIRQSIRGSQPPGKDVELMAGQGPMDLRLAPGARRADVFRALRALGEKGNN